MNALKNLTAKLQNYAQLYSNSIAGNLDKNKNLDVKFSLVLFFLSVKNAFYDKKVINGNIGNCCFIYCSRKVSNIKIGFKN